MKGYYTAWQEYGRVPWKDLFQHSIDLCNNGWEVTESMEISIQNVLSTIEDDEILRKQYIKDNGEPYKVGDIMTDPKLGHTLQQVADGPNVFYTGSLMQDIVNDIADAGECRMRGYERMVYIGLCNEDICMYINKKIINK